MILYFFFYFASAMTGLEFNLIEFTLLIYIMLFFLFFFLNIGHNTFIIFIVILFK